jgi:hypothetical protein
MASSISRRRDALLLHGGEVVYTQAWRYIKGREGGMHNWTRTGYVANTLPDDVRLRGNAKRSNSWLTRNRGWPLAMLHLYTWFLM